MGFGWVRVAVRMGVSVAFGLGLLPALASAQKSDEIEQADGGITCAASNECAPPRPHCHPQLHTCVECVGDRNCASGKVCKLDDGVCTECRSDADCTPMQPYCATARGECVECVTTANCGDSGIACQDGKCGTCGDGICGPREVLSKYFTNPGADDDGFTACPMDCASLCSPTDLGSAFGVFTASTAGLRNLSYGLCTRTGAGVDAFFKWKAPETGQFAFTGRNASLTRLMDGCTGLPRECGSEGSGLILNLMAGEEVFIALEAEGTPPATFELEIALPPPPDCDGAPCMRPDAGKGGAEQCLSNAQDHGDPMCSGVECACNHCPRDYDDCRVVPGCRQIADCMQEKDCIGAECYNSGACRGVIDSFGGISGPAFRAGSGLKSCALSFDCELPCEGEADAGVAPPPDAGQLCTPNATVVCTCGDRAGTKKCAADGMEFSACNCATAPSGDEDDGCGCRYAGAAGSGSLAAFALAIAVALARKRRRRTP
jgi:MYXO-CTERM domain-containing protein